MGIGDAELAHLLDLARLQLPPDEAEAVKHDLNRVLEYFDTLSDLDTEGLEPLVRPLPVEDAFRSDQVQPPLAREDALELGRTDEDGRFIVPRTIEEGN